MNQEPHLKCKKLESETDVKVSDTFTDFSRNAIGAYENECREKVEKYKKKEAKTMADIDGLISNWL